MKQRTAFLIALLLVACLIALTAVLARLETGPHSKNALIATSSTTTAPISGQDFSRIPEPTRELPEELKNARQFDGRYGYQSYGDDFGNTYVMVFQAKSPLWDCDVYFVSGDTITSLSRARAKLFSCMDIYTDGYGAWYLVDPGYVGMKGDTLVYRLQKDKVHKIYGLENLRGLDLYFDTKTSEWYGKWAQAGATREDMSTQVWHKINFPTLEGDIRPPTNTDEETVIENQVPPIPASVQDTNESPAVIISETEIVTPEIEDTEAEPVIPIAADYISSVAWPPFITRTPFTGSASMECTGDTNSLRTINTTEYCISTSAEGAAGSQYRSYTYRTNTLTEQVTATFVLRFPNCENYDEPKRSDCLQEQSIFDIDTLVDTEVRAALE